jgi:cytochrome P450
MSIAVKSVPVAEPSSPLAARYHARGLRDNTLNYLEELAQQGDFLRIRFGPISAYFVNHPDLVRDVLVTQASKFYKPAPIKRTVEGLIGYNLFSSDGDVWRVLRKAMQPAFHAKRIASYGDLMTRMTQETVASWDEGAVLDIPAQMMDLTLGITTKALFNRDLRDDQAGEAVLRFLELFNERITSPNVLPSWFPTNANREMRDAIQIGDDLLQPIIEARRASGEDEGDLLSMLIMAQSADDTGVLTDHQVRNEILNLFAAGYEVVAYSATFALYCISQHREVEARLLEELDSVLGGRSASADDLAKLPYLEQVIKEAMRLYPVTTLVGRQANEDVMLDGYTIPKNAGVIVAPWTLHRHPDFWEDALAFKPERFAPDAEAQQHKHAYIPFSTGPRICIGNAFAMMQLQLNLATILQTYRLKTPDDYVFEPMFRFNTRPKHGLPMQVLRR